MSHEKEAAGINATGVLQLIFLVLKLAHIVDWKWVWVLAPTWISIALVVLILLIVFIVFCCKELRRKALEKVIRERRERR